MGSKGNKCCCDNEVIRDLCFDGLGFTLAMESTCLSFCSSSEEYEYQTDSEDILNDNAPGFGINGGPGGNVIDSWSPDCDFFSDPILVHENPCSGSGNGFFILWGVYVDTNDILRVRLFVKHCYDSTDPSSCGVGSYFYYGLWEKDITDWNGTDDLVLTIYDKNELPEFSNLL